MFRKLVKALIPKRVFRVVEPYGHLLESVLWQVVMGFPARGLKVIGVTGTNGKTTTSFMIHRMLHEAGYKVGLMTTVGYGAGLDIRPQMTHMTTMQTRPMLRRIKVLREQGIEWLVLETTSHALAQNRVWAVPYSVAVMTNLTHEHLAYHGTFERYREAKVKLFRMTAANAAGLRVGVVNADDSNAPYFATAVPKVVRYGTKQPADLVAAKVKDAAAGCEYDAKFEGRTLHIRTQLPGSFNIYNSLAAAATGLAVGLEPEQIERGIAALERVEGRMARIDEGQDFGVMVDYAHSPDSFEKLFADTRPTVKGRLIVVFGSQGNTGDVGKREMQGRLAGEATDVVVVTEEDDRGEPGEGILDEIARGAEAAGKVRDKDLFLVHDRAEAISFAIKQARTGDMVLLLGKGHEKTIEHVRGEELPWDETGTARAALLERRGQAASVIH